MRIGFILIETLVLFSIFSLITYFIWRFANGKNSVIKSIPSDEIEKNKKTKDINTLASVLSNIISSAKDNIPAMGLVHLQSIHKNILHLVPKSREEQWNTQNTENTELIRKMVLSYIPDTLDDFLKLPEDFSKNYKNNENKTASDLLIESLSVLDKNMEHFSTTVFETDLSQMKIYRNFLYEKFNEKQSHFKNVE